MSRLEQLPEITDQVLSGLRADDSLKYNIYRKAAGISDAPEKKPSRLPVAALCAISAVMVAVFILISPLSRQDRMIGDNPAASDSYASPEMNHIPAGETLSAPPVTEPAVASVTPEPAESGDPEKELPDSETTGRPDETEPGSSDPDPD